MRAESLIRNSLDQAVDTEGTRGCSPKDHKNRCSDDHRSWVLHRWGGSQLPATNPFFASINLASLGFTTFAGLDDDVAIQFGSILKHPFTQLRQNCEIRGNSWPSELLHDHHHDIPGSHRPWQSMTEVAWKLSTKFSGILHRKHLTFLKCSRIIFFWQQNFLCTIFQQVCKLLPMKLSNLRQ